nr:B12-binding domain-containing protein [uncultured Marinifilum sp.]
MDMNSSDVSKQYLNALLAGKRSSAQQYCLEFIKEGYTIKTLYEQVMKPALYEVGKLWEQNKISVASEHLATAISEGILNTLYNDIIPEQYSGKKVVLACVEKEEHQVGIKMVADVFEMNQWESFFLGTGFPVSELIKFIGKIQPDMIAISLSVYFNFANLEQMLKELQNSFPRTKILIGGQALLHLKEEYFSKWNNICYISDLNALDKHLKNLQ